MSLLIFLFLVFLISTYTVDSSQCLAVIFALSVVEEVLVWFWIKKRHSKNTSTFSIVRDPTLYRFLRCKQMCLWGLVALQLES